MLTCQEMTKIVTDYLEGKMSFRDRVRFRMHILMCPHCRRYVAQMRLTHTTLGRLPEEPMPDEVRDALLERFRDWKRGK